MCLGKGDHEQWHCVRKAVCKAMVAWPRQQFLTQQMLRVGKYSIVIVIIIIIILHMHGHSYYGDGKYMYVQHKNSSCARLQLKSDLATKTH